ncbi:MULTISPECIES: DMT family transporter [Tsukamurella]|uniref:EamA family transporter n=2 Tax=Tsukamurella TaxID=2060 RepID=A0A5C5RXU2_9ACTN|nr:MULTISPECIES: EamA family transporter [Tsukamurella]NMD57967.1 EamA family transporter [Tsukamurella columbiensis]TWS26841.1 EamA family transporter [Tsukamurella conjunctivitidis]
MTKRLPALALVAVMFAWASAFVVIRGLGSGPAPHISPIAMAEGRLLVGAAVLGVIWGMNALYNGGVRLPRGRTLALTVGYGALWFALYTVLVNAAEQHLDAGTTALLVNIAPIIVAVLAGAFLHEGFPPLLVVGIAISFAGAAVIAFTGDGRRDGAGVALAVAAALLYGISVVAQKLVLRTVDPLTATALGAGVGAIVLLPWAPRLFDELAAAPIGSTVGVVYLGLVPTALAFLLWAYALAHTSAGVAASSSYAVPALSILLSWIFLSETPTAWGLLGGALCLVGVAVSRIRIGSSGRRPGAAPTATARPPAESARPTATPAGASC